MAFKDREEAAHKLAEALAHHRGTQPLVLAIPRGGVPLGRIIADALDGELDVALVHKIGAPGNPEFAIGAVDEAGTILTTDSTTQSGATDDYVETEAARQVAQLKERRRRYTPAHAPSDPCGRTVIVVDDGVATGATMRAALRMLRNRAPERLVAATAVASPDALEGLRSEADEVVCLDAPIWFHAVGQFFRNFSQVSDDTVEELLRSTAENRE